MRYEYLNAKTWDKCRKIIPFTASSLPAHLVFAHEKEYFIVVERAPCGAPCLFGHKMFHRWNRRGWPVLVLVLVLIQRITRCSITFRCFINGKNIDTDLSQLTDWMFYASINLKRALTLAHTHTHNVKILFSQSALSLSLFHLPFSTSFPFRCSIGAVVHIDACAHCTVHVDIDVTNAKYKIIQFSIRRDVFRLFDLPCTM